jgi:hypothetical protein
MPTSARDPGRAVGRRRGRLALVLILAGGLVVGAAGTGSADTAAAVEALLWDLQIVPLDGATRPPLALPGLDDRRYGLDAAGGRVVLLYFWASW